MAALPYMQLYVADYLADTAHLNAAQHGAYLLLLMNYWQRGKALVNSNERLANVARMSNEEWNKNRDVLAEFFEVTDDEWIHGRVERDLDAVRGISNRNKAAGLASANARATKRQQQMNERSTSVQRNVNHTDTDTDTEQDQDLLLDKSSERTPKRPSIPEKVLVSIYDVYPRKVGRGAALKRIASAVGRLAGGERDAPMEPIDAARALFALTKAYARSPAGKNPDQQYIPHPATWFNESRYLDDPETWQHTGGSHGKIRAHSSKTSGNADAARAYIASLEGDSDALGDVG